jgi:hypothetical protein
VFELFYALNLVQREFHIPEIAFWCSDFPSLVQPKYRDDYSGKILEEGISIHEIFEEVPIRIHNSALVRAHACDPFDPTYLHVGSVCPFGASSFVKQRRSVTKCIPQDASLWFHFSFELF